MKIMRCAVGTGLRRCDVTNYVGTGAGGRGACLGRHAFPRRGGASAHALAWRVADVTVRCCNDRGAKLLRAQERRGGYWARGDS